MKKLYEFVSAPSLVIETNCRDERTYWVNEGKRYTPMAAQAFSKFARGKDLQPGQVKHEAWRSETCVQKVQCIAEYQPGLWKDRVGSHNHVFLNPQFVPLRKLPAAADPPEKFVKLRDRRATLLKEEESKHDK